MSNEEKINLLNELGIFMDIDAFADAIIVPVKVEHYYERIGAPPAIRERIVTCIHAPCGRDGYNEIELPYEYGIPGEALAIIIPRRKEK